MTQTEQQAYLNGEESFYRGQSVQSNPFTSFRNQNREYLAWQSGWEDARSHDIQEYQLHYQD